MDLKGEKMNDLYSILKKSPYSHTACRSAMLWLKIQPNNLKTIYQRCPYADWLFWIIDLAEKQDIWHSFNIQADILRKIEEDVGNKFLSRVLYKWESLHSIYNFRRSLANSSRLRNKRELINKKLVDITKKRISFSRFQRAVKCLENEVNSR